MFVELAISVHSLRYKVICQTYLFSYCIEIRMLMYMFYVLLVEACKSSLFIM